MAAATRAASCASCWLHLQLCGLLITVVVAVTTQLCAGIILLHVRLWLNLTLHFRAGIILPIIATNARSSRSNTSSSSSSTSDLADTCMRQGAGLDLLVDNVPQER